MKNKILNVLAFLLFSHIVFSQNNDYKKYYELINKSEISSDTDSCISYIKKAFKVASPFPDELRTLSYYYFKKGDKKKSEKYLFEAIELGKQVEPDQSKDLRDILFLVEYDSGYIRKDTTSAYGKFRNSLYKEKADDFVKARKKYLETIDPVDNAIYESLLQNEYYFQSIRSLFWDEKVKDSVAYNYIEKFGSTPNSYYMLDLLKKKKFPERRKCARFNSWTINMLLNHAIAGFLKKEDALEFVTLLWELVSQGNLTPDEYAKAYDHYIACFVDQNKSYYGTRMYYNDDKKLALLELIDPKIVDQARKEHWLIPFESYLENVDVVPPKNYGK